MPNPTQNKVDHDLLRFEMRTNQPGVPFTEATASAVQADLGLTGPNAAQIAESIYSTPELTALTDNKNKPLAPVDDDFDGFTFEDGSQPHLSPATPASPNAVRVNQPGAQPGVQPSAPTTLQDTIQARLQQNAQSAGQVQPQVQPQAQFTPPPGFQLVPVAPPGYQLVPTSPQPQPQVQPQIHQQQAGRLSRVMPEAFLDDDAAELARNYNALIDHVEGIDRRLDERLRGVERLENEQRAAQIVNAVGAAQAAIKQTMGVDISDQDLLLLVHRNLPIVAARGMTPATVYQLFQFETMDVMQVHQHQPQVPQGAPNTITHAQPTRQPVVQNTKLTDAQMIARDLYGGGYQG